MAKDKERGAFFTIYLTIHGAAPTGIPQISLTGPVYLTKLATDGAGTALSTALGGFEAAMVGGIIVINEGIDFDKENNQHDIVGYTSPTAVTLGASAGANAVAGAGTVRHKEYLAATNMAQGADTYIWYHDFIIDYEAVIGQYDIIMSAVIDGVTYYAVDHYDVIVRPDMVSGDSNQVYY